MNEETREQTIHNISEILLPPEYDERMTMMGYVKKGETQSNVSSNAGREMALVYTKLQEAKMWVGKCLEQLGSELPTEFRDEAK